MNARNLHPSAWKNNPAVKRAPGLTAIPAAPPAIPAGRACCCPAKAVVRVVLPSAAGRPGETDLLLCAHHYRVSRHGLASAGAAVRELPGTPGDIMAWIHVGE